jgi:hypothetical protein
MPKYRSSLNKRAEGIFPIALCYRVISVLSAAMPRGHGYTTRPSRGSRSAAGRGRSSSSGSTPPLAVGTTPGASSHEDEGVVTRTSIPIPAFDPDDYSGWAFDMESYLMAAECWGAVDELSNQWAFLGEAVKTTTQAKAFNIICVSLGCPYHYNAHQYHPTQGKLLWEKLNSMFLRSDPEAHLQLAKHMANLQWNTSHHVDSFLANLANTGCSPI